MNILLVKDVKNLGLSGDVVEVSPGFGRNFLIPNRLGKEATPGEIRRAEKERAKRVVQKGEIMKNADVILAQIEALPLRFSRKVSSGKKLFGGVSESDIVEALEEQAKISLEKSQIHLSGGHLKTIGQHYIDVHLYEGKHARVLVEISPLS